MALCRSCIAGRQELKGAATKGGIRLPRKKGLGVVPGIGASFLIGASVVRATASRYSDLPFFLFSATTFVV